MLQYSKVTQSYTTFFCCPFRATMAWGGSQARGLIGALATDLHQRHSNARSEPHRWPTPQLRARQILNTLSETRDWTHNLMVPIQIHFCWAMMGTPIYILFSHFILHHVPTKVVRYSSLCCTAGSHCISTPNAIVCIYSTQTPSPSHSLPSPLAIASLLSMSLSFFLF